MPYNDIMADVNRVQLVGDNLVIHKDDGSRAFAYKTTADNWVVTGFGDTPVTPPDPDPETGDGVGTVPNTLTANDASGTAVTLNNLQLTRASQIISAGLDINGVNRAALVVALITALVESTLHIYSNIGKYPESANYPHDLDGTDGNSVGLFQQQPNFGWGSVQNCMLADYSTQAFIGGPDGPNNGSPRGLFDIAGWASKTPGQAAQAVQISAFPDRYDNMVPVANAILDALLVTTAKWAWPFKYSEWVIQSDPLAQYGYRINPVTGVRALHQGLDFGAGGIAGKPIPAAAAGTVTVAGYTDTMGNNVAINHGNNFVTRYFHMVAAPAVSVGQRVSLGTILGNVGSTGNSTGAHLHWETRVNGNSMNPRDFMRQRGYPEQ